MMLGIGIDLVEIARFAHWHNYTDAQLTKVFTHAEIAYCRTIAAKSAERFAVRFAAKEALFKALAPSAKIAQPPLLAVGRAAELRVTSRGAQLMVDWQILASFYHITESTKVHCTISHTATTSCSVVILENDHRHLHKVGSRVDF